MTFLLFPARAHLSNVRFGRFVEVIVALRTPSEKNPPVRAEKSGCILVDEREWEPPTGRRPES